MRYARLGFALFLVAFALTDIAIAGACCGDELGDSQEADATCYCCCNHVMVAQLPDLTIMQANSLLPILRREAPPFAFPQSIYHPPREL